MLEHDPMSDDRNTSKRDDLTEYFDRLSNIDVIAMTEPIRIVAERVSEIAAQINWDQINKCLSSIGNAVEKLTNPIISSEEIERRKEAYRAWGRYGWAVPLDAPWDMFNDPPCDQKDANRRAMQYCRKHNIEQVFHALEGKKYVRKADLQEAQFCFEHRKYKACSMILFSMIDARLIRLLKTQENKQRPSGKAAAKYILEHVEKEYDNAQRLFFTLRLENLKSCYDCIFAKGDDFKKQVPNINRNFVDHGMRWKAVNRTESIQVLLLYYETIIILDILNVRKIATAKK